MRLTGPLPSTPGGLSHEEMILPFQAVPALSSEAVSYPFKSVSSVLIRTSLRRGASQGERRPDRRGDRVMKRRSTYLADAASDRALFAYHSNAWASPSAAR